MAGFGPALVEGEDPDRVAVIIGEVVVKLDAGSCLQVGFRAGQQATDDVLEQDHLVFLLAAAPGPAVANEGCLWGVGKPDDVGVGGALPDEFSKVVFIGPFSGWGLAGLLGLSGKGLGYLADGLGIVGFGHDWVDLECCQGIDFGLGPHLYRYTSVQCTEVNI